MPGSGLPVVMNLCCAYGEAYGLSPLLLVELLALSSSGSSGWTPRFNTTTGGGFCSGRGGGGDTAPGGPLLCRVVKTRRRGMDMTMTTSSRLIRVTSTKLIANISSPT